MTHMIRQSTFELHESVSQPVRGLKSHSRQAARRNGAARLGRRSEPTSAGSSTMQLTVVGCGDAFGSGGRFNSCYLVESGGKTLALDFGASTMVALKQRGISPNTIDAVVLSHLHGDHFGGLPFLMLDSQFDSRRDKPLTIIGPIGTSERLPALIE